MNALHSHPLLISDPLALIETKMKLQNYSEQTIKAYLGRLRDFFVFLNPRSPNQVIDADITEYLQKLAELRMSRSTVDQAINALRFFWTDILGWSFPVVDLPRPEKKERAPVVLTLDEVRAIATAAGNLKHRLMIELAYSAGLRVSEIVNVRVGDVDLSRKSLRVAGAEEGGKSRTTIISQSLLDALTRQIGNKRPEDFLFPSERGGRLTTRAFAKYFKAALTASGIGKLATPHSLRHSFACCLLQGGAKVPTVQSLLGHARRESTLFYTKMTPPPGIAASPAALIQP